MPQAMIHAYKLPGIDVPVQELARVSMPRPSDLLHPRRLKELVQHENVVLVHCTIPAEEAPGAYFIQRSTCLLDHQARQKYPLLHAIGIGHENSSTDVVKLPGKLLHFTLYFMGLLKACSTFDLVESSTDPFPFIVRNIPRNRMDVYHLTLRENTFTHQPNNTH